MTELEARVAALEAAVTNIQNEKSTNSHEKNGWQKTVGMFSGDKYVKAVFDLALKFREADRKRTKPRLHRRKKAPAKT